MKLNFFYKSWVFLLMLLMFAWTNTSAGSGPEYGNTGMTSQDRPLVEVLDELSETFQVFFTYNDDLLNDVTVDFTLKKNEKLETAVNRLLAPAGFKYEHVKNKFFVIYRESQSNQKTVRKLKRKIDQINKLEEKGKFELRRIKQKPQAQLENIFQTISLFSKEIGIKGTVLTEDGEPLIGVTILVKGTSAGTTTDLDGTYQLDVPDDASTLVFSYIGYTTQEIPIAGRTTIDVTLVQSLSELAEVVVIGYGTTTKEKLVSSVSSLKTEEISKAPYTNIIQGMAGRVPGLITRESGGEYGSVASVSIRGGAEPLYVIDGVYASKEQLNLIPPDDIADISFLKDASATAIYGSVAGDGIILITTKNGSDKKLQVTYSADLSFTQETLRPTYMSSYEIALINNEAAFNDGLPAVVDEATLAKIKSGTDPLFPNTNWYEEAVRTNTPMSRHNLSMSGKINDTKVYLSTGYFTQEGVYKTGDHDLKRFSLLSKLDHTFSDIGLNIHGALSLQRSADTKPPAGTGGIWSHVRNFSPQAPARNPNGHYIGIQNPLAEADPLAGENYFEDNWMDGRLGLNWELPWVKGFTASIFGNYKYNNANAKNWSANQRLSAPLFLWDDTPVDMGNASLFQSNSRAVTTWLETRLHYIRSFGFHSIELTGVYNQLQNRIDFFSASRRDFASSAVDQLFAGSSVGKDNNGSASERARQGYVGRIKYDFNSRYIVETSFRYDGNDNFPEGRRWGLFPSVSVGWNLHNESFFQPVMDALKLSSFKIRASWGQVGLEDGTRFAYVPRYNLINNAYYADGRWVTGFREGPLVSDENTWFTRNSQNYGFDFGVWNNKFSGSFDWFYYRTTGYLGSPSDSYTTPLGKGLPEIKTDAAHRRGGLDLILKYSMKISDVNLTLGLNASYFDQLWEKKFDEDEATLKNPDARTTHEKDFYTSGYINQGYYQNTEQILNNPRRIASNSTQPGDLKYEDFNGDGKIDGNDFVRIGKGDFPHINYGFTIDAEYKGFYLNALIMGTSNRQIYLGSQYQNEINHKLYDIQMDNWSANNMDALFPRLSTSREINGNNNVVTSSFWLQDAWYVRLKSLSLSYDLKNIAFKNINGISGLSLILSGTNLFTSSPVTDFYLDPETSSSSNYGYPMQKVYNLGVRLTL